MPDWNAIVRERLHPIELPVEQQQEVVAELASHLEDIYDEQLQNGLTESEARARALNEVVQWRPLAQEIQHAKLQEKTVNARIKQLWLPTYISLSTAMLALIASGVEPRLYYDYAHHPVTTLYFAWLAALPLCGAAGAYLSREAGGEPSARLACGLSPAVCMLTVFCFVLLVSAVGAVDPVTHTASALFLWNWVFLPGTALLLGALPFLRDRNQSLLSELQAR